MADKKPTKTATPAEQAENEAESRFTDREKEALLKAWGCFKAVPEIDYDKFTAATGWSRGTCANFWTNMRKKDIFGGAPAASAAGFSPARTPRKRKATAKVETEPKTRGSADDEDDEDVEATPSKKAKTQRKATSAKVKSGPKTSGLAEDTGAEEETKANGKLAKAEEKEIKNEDSEDKKEEVSA